MALSKRQQYRQNVPGAVRAFAADHSHPFVVSNPHYSAKLQKAAEALARKKQALSRASETTRERIEQSVEQSAFVLQEKVIFWSMKNAMRAVELPVLRHRAVWSVIRSHSHILMFAVPTFLREHGAAAEYLLRSKKTRRHALAKIKEATREMNRDLDELLGSKRRKRLLYYFAQLYQGGRVYQRTIEDQLRDPLGIGISSFSFKIVALIGACLIAIV